MLFIRLKDVRSGNDGSLPDQDRSLREWTESDHPSLEACSDGLLILARDDTVVARSRSKLFERAGPGLHRPVRHFIEVRMATCDVASFNACVS